jgi:subtilisin family serine protease
METDIMRLRPPLAGALVVAVAASASAQVQSAPDQLAMFQQDKAALEQNPDLSVIPNSLLVKFGEKTPRQAVDAALAAAGASPVRTYGLVPGLVHARTTQPLGQAIATLSASPWVEFAEPDFVQRAVGTIPSDTYFGLQWGMHNTGQDIRGVSGTPDADIDMPEAWDIITGEASKVIAVLDTGTQWSHPDLDTNIWSNPGEIPGNGIDDDGNGYVDDVRGWDFYSGDNNPDDSDGHGTHTAGTIGAEGNDGEGVAGVLWDCQIMPLRFLGPFGGSTSDAIAALDYAVAAGCVVSNNSWGGGGYSSALYSAIDSARAAGHIFVAAAGNSGANTDSSPHYPSSYNLDNIISVAAIDNRDRLASFSNYGATSVDLGAPGVDIASTYSGSGYAWSSGTSMAAPHVAGVVALVQVQNPSWSYSQVIDRIYATVRPTTAMSGVTATGGVLNAFAALSGGGGGGGGNTAPSVTITSPADGSTYTEGASVTFTGSAIDAEDGDLSAQISWTSNLDGAIGAGASFSTGTLSVGDHTITASVTDGDGANGSDTVRVTIEADLGDPPAAPSNLAAADNADGTATVTWSDNADNESLYELQREEQHRNGRFRNATTISLPADTTSHTDATGQGTFRYRVRAVNDAGQSAWTGWVTVTVSGGSGGGGGGGGNGNGKRP